MVPPKGPEGPRRGAWNMKKNLPPISRITALSVKIRDAAPRHIDKEQPANVEIHWIFYIYFLLLYFYLFKYTHICIICIISIFLHM